MSRYFPTSTECGHHTIFGNIPIQTYAGEKMQISIVDLPLGSVVEWHHHVHEQMGVLASGRAMFHIGDEVKEIGPGEPYWMPSNVPHKVVSLEDGTRAIDFFNPPRDDYR